MSLSTYFKIIYRLKLLQEITRSISYCDPRTGVPNNCNGCNRLGSCPYCFLCAHCIIEDAARLLLHRDLCKN